MLVPVGVAVTLLAAGLSLALYNEHQVKAQKLKAVTVQAMILSGSVAAPLAFDDASTEREYVDALRANPDVEAAAVYDLGGHLAAGFSRAGPPLPATNAPRAPTAVGDRLIVRIPVAQGSATLGSVYLRVLEEPLSRRLTRYGGIALLVLMAALLVAGLGLSNGTLLEAQRRLRREMEERQKTEEALRVSQQMEAKAQLEVATERGRAALRASEENLMFALSAGDLGSWTRDIRTGRFTATALFCEHFGLEPDDPVINLDQFVAHIHPDDRDEQMRQVDEAIQNHTVLNSECRTVGNGGEVRWILIRGRAGYDEIGAPVKMAGVSMDVTARRQAEEVKGQLIDQLTTSNEEKGHFANVAAHDLREPLRMVAAFCSLLSENYGKQLDERGREYIALMVSAAKQMQELLDDLVDFGRLGAEAERNSWFESGEAFQRVLENLHEAILESNAEVTGDPMPRIYGNQVRFIRLVQNLVGNGIKYVQPGVSPRIHVAVEQAEGFWRFTVSDNGIGIEPRHFDRIFEPFKRLHPKSSYKGTGLGLAICRKIVDGFGGTIGVRSTLGEGSVFDFTVKISDEPDDHKARPAPAMSGLFTTESPSALPSGSIH